MLVRPRYLILAAAFGIALALTGNPQPVESLRLFILGFTFATVIIVLEKYSRQVLLYSAIITILLLIRSNQNWIAPGLSMPMQALYLLYYTIMWFIPVSLLFFVGKYALGPLTRKQFLTSLAVEAVMGVLFSLTALNLLNAGIYPMASLIAYIAIWLIVPIAIILTIKRLRKRPHAKTARRRR